jgi:hypothetical protein
MLIYFGCAQGDRSSYHQLVGVLHHRDRSAPDKVALLLVGFFSESKLYLVSHCLFES